MISAGDLKSVAGLEVYETSLAEAGGATYFLARRGTEKLVGMVGAGVIVGDPAGELSAGPVVIGPTGAANAAAIRSVLDWTAPKLVGLGAAAGMGDRLGLATPAHVRAVRGTGLAPVLAQQSIREMTRTGRTPRQVIDDATWGVFQEGYADSFGADADHLQRLEDIDATTAAGFTMFTIDPGAHVEDRADQMSPAELKDHYARLDFDALDSSPADLESAYNGRAFLLEGGGAVRFSDETFLRAAVKYGRAVAHTVKMYRHLLGAAATEFELEVSVDETASPTSAAEHYFFAAELKRMAVEWVSLAPRFVGRFEKGVDYIGDLEVFRHSFAEHVAVMRTLGPYKISIHSGSDKFSIYPIVAQLTGGLVHLKTAGTSYLEALRAVAVLDAGLFREILDFARGRYETDRATYHVSADASKVPASTDLADEGLPTLLDDFHARQMLHVTFGSVLTADGGERFRRRLYDVLQRDEEAHYAAVQSHLARHVAPFVR